MTWEVRQGDCIEEMRGFDEASIDAIVTDPPYGLEFMGKEWDSLWRRSRNGNDVGRDSPQGRASRTSPEYAAGLAAQEWHYAWAVEALRVLKPGGHLLAFGGTRTYHRLACAVEDAGFEVRDSLIWLYGSGFPKSLNLDGDHAGWGTALKPGHEPVVVARKPLIGTVAANVQAHGTGALNVDGCRIEGAKAGAGRWPGNVVLSHLDGCELLGTRAVAGRRDETPSEDEGRADTSQYRMRPTPATSRGYADENGREEVEEWRCAEGCPAAELDRQSGPAGGSGFEFLGIEREAEYVEIARARLAWWEEHPEGPAAPAPRPAPGQMTFG